MLQITVANGNLLIKFSLMCCITPHCLLSRNKVFLANWLDVTDVAIEWANQNVNSNPHISGLIEIRRVHTENKMSDNRQQNHSVAAADSNCEAGSPSSIPESCAGSKNSYRGPPVLSGVVKDGEKFDFCMCNPPFFETMEESGLNPKTSCGGTPAEMVCSGGEFAFITRIIEDSVKLRDTFRWYTSMVGRRSNLNSLVSDLWSAGATIVKTTVFVQGKTSRWGLTWSFLPTALRKTIVPRAVEKSNPSFMMEVCLKPSSSISQLSPPLFM